MRSKNVVPVVHIKPELTVKARPFIIERMVQDKRQTSRDEFATRLREALSYKKVEEHGSGVYLKKVTGVTDKAASKWINAESMPGDPNIVAIARDLGVSVEWLRYGIGEMIPAMASPVIADEVTNEEYAFIPVMSVKAAAGEGHDNFHEVSEGTLAFRRDWMHRCGLKEENLRLIRATGESMEPTINDGDMLLVDVTVNVPISGSIYALRRPDGSLSVKRLSQGFSGEWTIISDNRNKDKYRDEPIGDISTSNVPIAGRVVWRGGMM